MFVERRIVCFQKVLWYRIVGSDAVRNAAVQRSQQRTGAAPGGEGVQCQADKTRLANIQHRQTVSVQLAIVTPVRPVCGAGFTRQIKLDL